MCESFYDKFQPYFGQNNFELAYIDTESFIISFTPNKRIAEGVKFFDEGFHLTDFDP